MVLALILVSCQKEETENDLIIEESQEQEEGFISKTGNNDSEINPTSDVMSPLLHIQYDASLSKEEAAGLFHAAVSKFEKEKGYADRPSSYFNFEVRTKTSTLVHSQTDGNVWARFNFLTDKGHQHLPWVKLNNEGNDRESGAWDFYYFGTHASSINWLEAESATLALQGTNGWHVTFFDVYAYHYNQPVNASGKTRILSNPETWLDNTTSSGWDYYNTGNIGTYRLNFD